MRCVLAPPCSPSASSLPRYFSLTVRQIYQLDNLRLFGLDHNPLDNIPADVVGGGSQRVFNFLGERASSKGGKPAAASATKKP